MCPFGLAAHETHISYKGCRFESADCRPPGPRPEVGSSETELRRPTCLCVQVTIEPARHTRRAPPGNRGSFFLQRPAAFVRKKLAARRSAQIGRVRGRFARLRAEKCFLPGTRPGKKRINFFRACGRELCRLLCEGNDGSPRRDEHCSSAVRHSRMFTADSLKGLASCCRSALRRDCPPAHKNARRSFDRRASVMLF